MSFHLFTFFFSQCTRRRKFKLQALFGHAIPWKDVLLHRQLPLIPFKKAACSPTWLTDRFVMGKRGDRLLPRGNKWFTMESDRKHGETEPEEMLATDSPRNQFPSISFSMRGHQSLHGVWWYCMRWIVIHWKLTKVILLTHDKTKITMTHWHPPRK